MTLFRSHFLFLSLFLLPILSFGQQGDGKPAPNGKITGIVQDVKSNEGVGFSAVSLLRKKDSSVAGGNLTDVDGNFEIAGVAPGNYILRVKSIGYSTKIIDNVNITAEAPVFSAGSIKLGVDSKTLQEIDVVTEKAVFQNSIDKKVFNVDKSIVSQGGSASDVLNQVPSVSVDIDGNISMRGNGNITVLIDGKPSSITGTSRAAILDQIPASTIDRIELITNPSAKYDPDGMAGIINIILKKNRAPGFNGNVSASAGDRNKYNLTSNLSLRTRKLNISANYSYRYNERWGNGYSDRNTKISGDTSILIQHSDLNSINQSHMGKIALDYEFNDKNTLSIGSVYNYNTSNHPENNQYGFYSGDSIFRSSYGRNAVETNKSHSLDVTMDYKKTFVKPQEQWTISMAYSGSMGNDGNTISQNNLNESGNIISGGLPLLQSNMDNTKNQIITIQSDFTLPLTEQSKLEFGYKSVLRNVDNNFHADSFNHGTSQWINDSLITNHFIYKENVHAVYAMYSQTIKNFSLQAGSRFEESFINSELVNSNKSYPSNYFNIYPSLHLSEKLSSDQEVQLSYSRRVNRPGFQSLNPFTDYSDPLNLRVGNPLLRPEYVNNYELAYSKSWQMTSMTVSAYYKDIRGINKMLRKLEPDNPNVIITTWENLSNGISYGFEIIGRTAIRKWWNITGSANLYRTILNNAGGDAADMSASNYSGVGKYTSNMTLWKGIQLQISGNYNGPSIFPGGHIEGIYYTDAGIRKDFLKGKWVVSLNGNDIFNQRRYIIYSSGDGFTQYMNRKRESRVAMATLTYKFGKADIGSKKNKGNNENRNEGGGEDF